MIGRLRGIIAEKHAPALLIDVGGVFYELSAPMTTFYNLPEVGETYTLFTHMVVREDAQLLYGFHNDRERSLFRSLIRVNGVGPKLALTILSGMEPERFVRCIQSEDASQLTGIPGIGKKTAERLIIETRDMLAKWEINLDASHTTTSETTQTDDAIAALGALGYKPIDAKRAVQGMDTADKTSEQIIRLALKEMMT
jgi:holliday junction DNA helicase RuvA